MKGREGSIFGTEEPKRREGPEGTLFSDEKGRISLAIRGGGLQRETSKGGGDSRP